MTKEKFIVLAKRFLRGFIAGGLAAMTAQIEAGLVVQSLEDTKKIGFSLATAFITGGLMAIDKTLRWQDEQ